MPIKSNRYNRFLRKGSVSSVESENSNEISKKNVFRIPETIILSAIPIAAFILLYFYESRYFSYFGIPSQYISFELQEIIIYVSVISIFVLVFYWFFSILLDFGNELKSKDARKSFKYLVALVAYFCVHGYISSVLGKEQEANFILALCGLPILWILIPPWSKLYQGTYRERLEQHLSNFWRKKSGTSLLDETVKIIGVNVFRYFFVFILVIWLSSRLGLVSAISKGIFPIIKTNPECVVLYTKSDFLICTEFDRTNNEFLKGYQVYYLDEIQGVRIDEENIGPLHPKPTPTPTPTLTPIPTSTQLPTATLLPTARVDTSTTPLP